MATVHLFQSIPEEQLLQVAKYTNAKQILDALNTRPVGVDRV
jgi:hypothetical protein